MTRTVSSDNLSAAPSQEPELGFGEPWQAEAFATALQLSRAGVFTWSEWVEAFSGTISSEPMRAGEAVGDAYYRQWMSTLEAMVGERLCVSETEVSDRQALWHSAYLNARHGDPVSLDNATKAAPAADEHPDHHHHHHSGDKTGVKRPVPKPAVAVRNRN